MSDDIDIVERLRARADPTEQSGVLCDLLREAADEIKRLRCDVADWRWACDDATSIVERLRDSNEYLVCRSKMLANKIERLRAELRCVRNG